MSERRTRVHYRIEGQPLAECGSRGHGETLRRWWAITCPICERIARHDRIIKRCMPLLVDGMAWSAGELAHRIGKTPHQISAVLNGDRGQRAGVRRRRCRGARWVYWCQGPEEGRSSATGKSKPM